MNTYRCKFFTLVFLLSVLIIQFFFIKPIPIEQPVSAADSDTGNRIAKIAGEILADIDKFNPSKNKVNFFYDYEGLGINPPDNPKNLALATSKLIARSNDPNVQKVYDEYVQYLGKNPDPSDLKTPQQPDVQTNREKIQHLINSIYRVRDLPTRYAIFKNIDPLLKDIVNKEGFEAADLVREKNQALLSTFRLAVIQNNREEAIKLFNQFMNEFDYEVTLTEIQGTGHSLVIGEEIGFLLPWLLRIDLEFAFKQGEEAAKLTNSAGYDAEMMLLAVRDQAIKDKSDLTPETINKILKHAEESLNKSYRSPNYIPQMTANNKKLLEYVRTLVKYREDKFIMYRVVTDRFFLGTNHYYARAYIDLPNRIDDTALSITELIERMMAIDRQRTQEHVEKVIVPKLPELVYILEEKDDEANKFTAPSRENGEVNKVAAFLFFSNLLRDKNPELAKKLAFKTMEIISSKWHENDKEKTDLDYMANESIAAIARFDTQKALELAKKFRVNMKELTKVLVMTDPEKALEMGTEDLYMSTVVKLAVYLARKDVEKGIEFFRDYLKTHPGADVDYGDSQGVHTAAFIIELSKINTARALILADEMSDVSLKKLTLYYILKEKFKKRSQEE